MKIILTSILLILLSSCGLKVISEINENVLVGEWKLNKVVCYSSSSSTVSKEEYLVSSAEEIEVKFEAQTFSYSVLTQAACLSSGHGSYSTSFDGSKKGAVSFNNVITSVACSLSLVDITGSAGTISVPISLLSSDSSDLYWSQISDTLELQVFTGFKGSVASSCLGQCVCRGEYLKK